MYSNQMNDSLETDIKQELQHTTAMSGRNNKNSHYQNDANTILPDNGYVDEPMNSAANHNKTATLFTIQELDSTNESYPTNMDMEDYIDVKSEPILEEDPVNTMRRTVGGTAASSTNKADSVRKNDNFNHPYDTDRTLQHRTNPEILPINDKEDSQNLLKILKQFDLEVLFNNLKTKGITYRSLRYLSKDDIKEALPLIGLRAEFREKLFAWRRKEFNMLSSESVLADVEVLNNKIVEPAPLVQQESENGCLLNIRQLMDNCTKGKTILSFYNKNNYLHNKHREYLIAIIVEEVLAKNMKLRSSDFQPIVDQILTIFPSEADARDFYFISRQGRKNPGGKLYCKYINAKSKKMKFDSLEDSGDTNTNNTSIGCMSTEAEIEFDEKSAYLLKAELKGNITDWNVVCDKWLQSYGLRRRDLNELGSIIQFLEEWPKYLDTKGVQLFKIDFKLRYKDSDSLLFTKWNDFKKGVKDYYIENVCKPQCKELLTELLLVETVDAEDYILASLLTSVLQPTARVTVSGQKKKLTILDSRDCFTLHLTSLREYKAKIEEIFLNNNMSINGIYLMPIIIVVGEHSYDVSGFYIHFGKTIYRMDSYLECLDVSFKIYKTLNLEFPPATQFPWAFIQKYFYEIDSSSIKSSNITALINFLRYKS